MSHGNNFVSGDVIEVSYRGKKIVGEVAGIFRAGNRRHIGIYTEPLEVESYQHFPLKEVGIRRL